MSALVLSLFPGIGLLDMAFEEQGFTVVRGPDVLWGGDVRLFHPPAGVFDGVIGGPPCQAFSTLANLVRAKGHEPRFGNLIPEFERCIAEATSCSATRGWQARTASGQEQERRRRFSFGWRGAAGPDLRRWIRQAALLLPTAPAVLGDAARAKGRQPAVRTGGHLTQTTEYLRTRQPPVLGRISGESRRRGERRTLAEMCRLQGLPEDFLADAPFTSDGKRKAIANGVPLPMGRAIAQAVAAAIGMAAPAAVLAEALVE